MTDRATMEALAHEDERRAWAERAALVARAERAEAERDEAQTLHRAACRAEAIAVGEKQCELDALRTQLADAMRERDEARACERAAMDARSVWQARAERAEAACREVAEGLDHAGHPDSETDEGTCVSCWRCTLDRALSGAPAEPFRLERVFGVPADAPPEPEPCRGHPCRSVTKQVNHAFCPPCRKAFAAWQAKKDAESRRG